MLKCVVTGERWECEGVLVGVVQWVVACDDKGT